MSFLPTRELLHTNCRHLFDLGFGSELIFVNVIAVEYHKVSTGKGDPCSFVFRKKKPTYLGKVDLEIQIHLL